MKDNIFKKIFNITLLYILISYFIGFFSYNLIMGNITGFKGEDRSVYVDEEKYEMRDKYLNKKVPDIKAKTIDGDIWNINDYNNKVILLHFWVAPCLPCLAMTDQLKDINNKYKGRNDFKMFGISGISYDVDLINCYIKTKGINWPQLIDEYNFGNKPIFDEFNIPIYPSFWIIGKNGNFVAVDLREVNEVKRVLNKVLK